MSDISSINGVNDGFSEHYTPTTEEVRDVYQSRLIKISKNRFEVIDQVQADAEFDRWLTEVKAEAWQQGYTAGKPYPQLISKNPYIPEIGKTPQHLPESGNNV